MDERMTMKEASRFSVMKQIDKKILSIRQASHELGLSTRQVKRLRKKYKQQGAKGIISLRRGRPNARRYPETLKMQVMDLMKDPLREGWGPTFASEKLASMNQIMVSREKLRQWMIEEGLWKSKKKTEKRVHQRRPRRSRFGEMIQGDGSPHAWLEGRGPKSSLLIFVDDATSKITSGKFFPAETTEGYLEVLEGHLQKYGRPSSLYVDKHSIFRKNRTEMLNGDLQTHFGKVLRELDIRLICAHSPQAKGRVERTNSTLQDRLIKEMRLKGISSIEEANAYLPAFIEEFNDRFGRVASEREDAHRPLAQGTNLERIFARKTTRKLSKELSFSYEGTTYHLKTKSPNRVKKTHVELILVPNKPLIVEINGKAMEYTKWKEAPYQRTPILDSKELEGQLGPQRKKPSRRHPWR